MRKNITEREKLVDTLILILVRCQWKEYFVIFLQTSLTL